jgi:heme A synthase
MACGEDWPLCRGRWLPTLDAPTLLEYGHRLAAAGVSVLVLVLAAYTFRHRREPGFAGRGGYARPAALAAGLLVAQVLLGAVTVTLRLPSGIVATHLATAMATLAALLVAALRATPLGEAVTASAAPVADRTARKAAGAAFGAAALGYLVIVFGAVVANTGAAPLCPGFPLCGGRIIPEGGALVHIHWTHRVLAYLLVVHVAGATIAAWRKPVAPAVRWAASAAAALVSAQVAVAAALVLVGLPRSLQALHLAVGTAVWGALVVWAVLARRAANHVAVSSSGTE